MCTCAGHVRQVVTALNLAGWWINQKTIFPILYEVFLFVMAHLMSSAQIDSERDFSAASLVLRSNRGSMDAKHFQAQLCFLMNLLHWHLVHPEDMSPKSMSAKEVSGALPAHGFGVPDIPKGSMMTPTTRDMTVRETETYTQCIVLSNKVFLVC